MSIFNNFQPTKLFKNVSTAMGSAFSKVLRRQTISTVIRLCPQQGTLCICEGQEVQRLPVDTAMLNRGEIALALDHALSQLPQSATVRSAIFILAPSAYGVDYLTLPNMKKAQLEESFKTEMRSMYKNYEGLTIRSTEVNVGKTSSTYRVAFARTTLLNEIKSCFLRANIKIVKFVPYGVALLEGAERLNASRKSPYLLLDIGNNSSYIAACGKDTLLGGLELPFGADALSSTHVLSERVLWHRDSAELLVINARERAKSIKLTMAINLEAEKIDDSVPNASEESATTQAEANKEATTTTTTTETAAADKDDFDEEEDVPEKDLSPTVKTLKRTFKQLPKFMRREEPTTAEGYIQENFRLFEKRVLLTARDMALNEYLPNIETIYLSMPSEFAFLAEKMNELNPTYKWVYLDKSEAHVDDLAIYGGALPPTGKMPVF